MAVIGLKKPFYAKYSNTGANVTYSDGGLMGKDINFNATPTVEEVNLYADNDIAETENIFKGGEGTVNTDHLTQEVTKAILGVKEQPVPTGAGISESDAKELIFDDDMKTPYLGIGHIVHGKVNGEYKYRAIVLLKVKFSVPEDSIATRGETVVWQTPTIKYKILKSDAEKHPWKRQCDFSDEADAEAYIKHILDIKAV